MGTIVNHYDICSETDFLYNGETKFICFKSHTKKIDVCYDPTLNKSNKDQIKIGDILTLDVIGEDEDDNMSFECYINDDLSTRYWYTLKQIQRYFTTEQGLRKLKLNKLNKLKNYHK